VKSRDIDGKKVPRTQYVYHSIDEVIRIGLRLDETNRRLKARPLFFPAQPAFAKQNQARMQLNVFQQFKKIVCVGRHDSHVMLHRKFPNSVIRLPIESYVRHRLRKSANFSKTHCEGWREMLIEQQAQSQAARAFLRNSIGLIFRSPGDGFASRSKTRA